MRRMPMRRPGDVRLRPSSTSSSRCGDFSRTIRLAGQPYGRPVEFLITDGQKTSEYLVARKITTTFGCWLETKASVSLPPFEVALRSPNQSLVAPQSLADRPQMAEASTGDPQLDAKFVVRTSDPRIAPALVPALRAISGELYVHIAGEGERLWSSITRMGLPYFSVAAEKTLFVLESAACGIEGRPVPASPRVS